MRAHRFRRLIACRRGVSALEFALVAPFLCIGLLLMVDIGLGIVTRMELERNVRSGAQAAMTLENDADQVAAIVGMAAGNDTVSVDVGIQCQCGAASTSCEIFCRDGSAPSVFYAIRAERPHPGPLLDAEPIVASARVKVR